MAALSLDKPLRFPKSHAEEFFSSLFIEVSSYKSALRWWCLVANLSSLAASWPGDLFRARFFRGNIST
jgi:hypothetical protein